jgi:hypothetical protein
MTLRANVLLERIVSGRDRASAQALKSGLLPWTLKGMTPLGCISEFIDDEGREEYVFGIGITIEWREFYCQ